LHKPGPPSAPSHPKISSQDSMGARLGPRLPQIGDPGIHVLVRPTTRTFSGLVRRKRGTTNGIYPAWAAAPLPSSQRKSRRRSNSSWFLK